VYTVSGIASHLMSVGSFGMELGASTIFLYSLRERERILGIFEMVTGLRMNHAYIRPGGVAQDLPAGALGAVSSLLDGMPAATAKLRKLMDANPVYLGRTKNIAYLDLAGCMALGVTGPVLRSTGLPWDLRKSQPYCGYESYDFEIAMRDTCDVYGRYLVRMDEMDQSAKRVERQLVLVSGPVTEEVECDNVRKARGSGRAAPARSRLRRRRRPTRRRRGSWRSSPPIGRRDRRAPPPRWSP
jgi:NADH-quinone oxidoreductase subunit D